MALREIKVRWETFNFTVYCVIGPYRFLSAYIKKRHRRAYKAKAEADLAGLYFASIPKRGAILWLPEEPKTPKQIAVLAHEVSHAVIDMHASRGINLDNENDEPFCYSIQFGIETILKSCK